MGIDPGTVRKWRNRFAAEGAAGLQDRPSAANVRTGKPRTFTDAMMPPGIVRASACLSRLFQAVAVDGEHHRDGGYVGDPAI